MQLAVGMLALVMIAAAPRAPASATPLRDEFRATLASADRQAFDAYVKAQIFHAAALDAYWSHVEKKRAQRKLKRRRDRPTVAGDYVQDQPPAYEGPQMAKGLARRWQAFQDAKEKEQPPRERETLPTVDDFLDSARRHFEFVPERVREREFKERYAREALALNLSGDQVVRVYALETGGLGTADMQAGIHPISRKGAPISTALGYAQLLAANSVNELAKHGSGFVERLRSMAQRASGERRERLLGKARALERMVRKAKSVPYVWSRHVAFASTDVGRGLHAVNLDGDIGPWLQVIKLKGLKETAAAAGRGRLTGAEIELMNLAGPGTGLEMMTPAGRAAPTTNFFARAAYYRNTIVRGKTSAELLKALDQRMDDNLKNSGSVEFKEVFAKLKGARRADN